MVSDEQAARYRAMRRLYTFITTGSNLGSIHGDEDAKHTAAVLRLLADELDPRREGHEKARIFYDALKNEYHY